MNVQPGCIWEGLLEFLFFCQDAVTTLLLHSHTHSNTSSYRFYLTGVLVTSLETSVGKMGLALFNVRGLSAEKTVQLNIFKITFIT